MGATGAKNEAMASMNIAVKEFRDQGLNMYFTPTFVNREINTNGWTFDKIVYNFKDQIVALLKAKAIPRHSYYVLYTDIADLRSSTRYTVFKKYILFLFYN